MTVSVLAHALLVNVHAIAKLLIVRSSLLPEFIWGLHYAEIITEAEANNFDDFIDITDTAEGFAVDVIQWVADYIQEPNHALADKLFVSKLFVSYINWAQTSLRVAEVYDSKGVDIDFISLCAMDE